MMVLTTGTTRARGRMAVCKRGCYVVFAALAAASLSSLVAHASDCTGATDGIAVTCIGQVRQSGLDQMFANDPAHGRLDSRLAGQSWISSEWASAPFAWTPSGSSLSMKTSAGHWGTLTDYRTMKRFEEAQALAPEGMILPKPVLGKRSMALDVWSTLDAASANLDPDRGIRGGVGADYKLNPNTVVGIAVDVRDGVGNTDTLSEQGHTLAAYFALRPLPALTFDTTAQWGESGGSAAGQAFGAEQNSLQARLRGNWSIEQLRFTPTLAFSHGIEHLDAAGDALSTEKNAVTFTPRISRPFALDDGKTIEPFLQYQTELAVGSTDLGIAGEDDLTRSAGAGLTFVNPNAYSLSVTTDVEGINQEEPNLRSHLQLTVPLK